MKLSELVAFGERLSKDLQARAERYNVRSDLHDILNYESLTVDAYLRLLTRAEPVPADRRQSVLLGEWGRAYEPWDEPDLIARTTEFYRLLQERGIATN